MINIENYLKNIVYKNQSPSVQYAFFNTDSVIYRYADGFRNIASKTRVDSSTTFNLFSITKTFTAISILQLAQSGSIELNRPAYDYLPEFPYPKQITILQLLYHSSGIPNPLPLRWVHLPAEHTGFDRNLFFKNVFQRNKSVKFDPGTKFSYSNLGYVLLGQLIEAVSGKSYESYVKEKIFDIIGISSPNLGFNPDPSMHATGYQKWLSASNALLELLIDKRKFMGAKEGKWKPFNIFYVNGTPYGGMIGSLDGLVRYAQVVLQIERLLLQKPFSEMLFAENMINNKPTGMAISWFTGILNGNKYFTHAGGGGGYYAELRIYPALGKGSVIMLNRSGMSDERILDKADGFYFS